MAVNRINQTHSPQVEKAHTLSAPKTQSATPKATSANTAAKESRTGETQGTTAAASAENNAGREQGHRQNADESLSKGTLLNVKA
jgi:hypothetical protein